MWLNRAYETAHAYCHSRGEPGPRGICRLMLADWSVSELTSTWTVKLARASAKLAPGGR